VRVFAVIGALVATGLAAYVFLLGGAPAAGEAPAAVEQPPVRATSLAKVRAHTTPAARRRPSPASEFPWQIRRALAHRSVVVVAVYVPGAAVDRLVRSEAQAGAKMSHAAFVHISASNGPALQKLVAETGVLPAPAVVIVRRPGVVVTTLGVIDRETVAAAVAQAKPRR
jgi:hypothetical protein